RIAAAPVVCDLLHACWTWVSPAQLAKKLARYEPGSIVKTLSELERHDFVERSSAARNARKTAMDLWSAWNPAAGFLHFATKEQDFSEDHWGDFQRLKRPAGREPMLPPFKSYAKASKTPLPHTPDGSEFVQVLRDRRTWRKFSAADVPFEKLA